MKLTAGIIDSMVAAGATVEVLAAAMKAAIAEDEAERAAHRAKEAGWKREQRTRRRLMSTDVHRSPLDRVDNPPPPPVSPTPPSEKTPTPARSLRSQRAREDDPEFTEFWLAYPNKVGKPEARLKWPKAREKAHLSEILDGLQRYITEKPPDRPWCNPATWLHQERWNDEPLYAQPELNRPRNWMREGF